MAIGDYRFQASQSTPMVCGSLVGAQMPEPPKLGLNERLREALAVAVKLNQQACAVKHTLGIEDPPACTGATANPLADSVDATTYDLINSLNALGGRLDEIERFVGTGR